MPTAKRLPSGAWRVRVYSHMTIEDGRKKQHYESFTADTKREAEAMAAEWAYRKSRPQNITVGEAIDRYITSKEAVLSPSTIRGYRSCQRTLFDAIKGTCLRDLSSESVQIWISDISKEHSPKTVRNANAILTAALGMFAPDMHFTVSLPQKVRHKYTLPSDEDVQKLLDYAKGDLWIAIELAYYYGLRRGEICALTSSDLSAGGDITISKDLVIDVNKEWIVKQTPKTADSYRVLRLQGAILDHLRTLDGKFIQCTPDCLLDRFRRAQRVCGIEPFNFHLLRHCFATRAAKLGINDIYTAKLGGWRPGSSILKEVYQNAQEDDVQDALLKISCHDSCHDSV